MKKAPYFFVVVFLILTGCFIILPSCRKYLDDYEQEPPVELLCTLNIRGGCFDQWVNRDDGSGFKCLEPAGDYLRTLNYLYTLPTEAGGPGPKTTFNTSDSYAGTYAALLVTGSFSPMGSPIIIPGLVGTDSLDIPNATIRVGKPYTAKPLRFQGYYKYEPVGGDSALVSVLLSKFNSGAGKRDTIGLARQVYKNTVTTYTSIDLPFTYFSTETPDTLTLLICSSADIRFNDLMNCKGQVGSKFWIDEISFVMP
ncbi:MAG TPA: PCMD domain-containing protein [Bacteroidales bacterium]|nr:PCMD domain-containing protein [Bacteroidales bacterium]